MPQTPVTASIHPRRAIPGARVTIRGTFATANPALPAVHIGGLPARVVFASPDEIAVIVPSDLPGGWHVPVVVNGMADADGVFLDVAGPFATGLHQVDSPVFDRAGNLYVTYSGTRGQQVPVSIFRVTPQGARESFSSGIVNPTSMAVDQDDRLYISSRFEGIVYRLDAEGGAQPFASGLGVVCGLAFAPDGRLFAGDRSGTIFAVSAAGKATPFASLPSSVAAFHLAFGPDGTLFVTGPTLATYDAVYAIDADGTVQVRAPRFGRPQGLAVDSAGELYVTEALAGASGLYRLADGGDPELVLAGPGLVGVALDADGGLVVCSNDTAFRLPGVV